MARFAKTPMGQQITRIDLNVALTARTRFLTFDGEPIAALQVIRWHPHYWQMACTLLDSFKYHRPRGILSAGPKNQMP